MKKVYSVEDIKNLIAKEEHISPNKIELVKDSYNYENNGEYVIDFGNKKE